MRRHGLQAVRMALRLTNFPPTLAPDRTSTTTSGTDEGLANFQRCAGAKAPASDWSVNEISRPSLCSDHVPGRDCSANATVQYALCSDHATHRTTQQTYGGAALRPCAFRRLCPAHLNPGPCESSTSDWVLETSPQKFQLGFSYHSIGSPWPRITYSTAAATWFRVHRYRTLPFGVHRCFLPGSQPARFNCRVAFDLNVPRMTFGSQAAPTTV